MKIWSVRIALAFAALFLMALAVAYVALRGSLPQINGELRNAAITQSVELTRDSMGVPTIKARDRVDLAFATGYAHGQDRFFQMDVLRRVAAGELAALLGEGLIDTDRRMRRHNFRAVARKVFASASPRERDVISAYVKGVNAAVQSLRVRPFEYLLLQSAPKPWSPEDSLLVAYAMYIDLNDSDGARELERARLHAVLPPEVFAVLYPRGTEWDAPLNVADLAYLAPALPTAEQFDLRRLPPREPLPAYAEPEYPGSNNWAVAGNRTRSGVALIANDMHLGLRVPHIWYRARMMVSADGAHEAGRSQDPADLSSVDLIGVTLPGLPVLVAGSNRHIAWGFTNTHGDFDDLVIVETDPANPGQYRDGESFVPFQVRRERIEVRAASAVDVEYRDTIWGPLLDETLNGKALALAWTAQHPEATNLKQLEFEGARDVHTALAIANRAGIPVQNFVVGDAQGQIAWTAIGKLPKRKGFDGRLPRCWGCERIGWDGWLDPKDYPRVVNPSSGQLWSANSRTFANAADEPDAIGDEDMDRGARTRQIRDGLTALSRATAADMLSIQLDDRALFLKRWRDLLVRLQDEAYLRGKPMRRAALNLVDGWSGRAGVDDAGYRIVRAFRTALQEDIYADLIAPAQRHYPDAKFRPSARFEDTLWRIVTSQPAHLLNPKFARWDLRILASLDRALALLAEECDVFDKTLDECTWGRRNTLRMQHALSGSVPVFGRWLAMPSEPLPGDNDMPRVQSVAFGASQRFSVSPGREEDGYFHMPGGQSGHPLSSFFSSGHSAWVKGERTPFLPGVPRHTLRLLPE